MFYTIKTDRLTVEINDFGAELTSVKLDGKERLWQNENGGWAGHAPVMFPACGSCDVVVNGKLYPHFRHGFSRKNTFEVTEQTATSVTFRLTSNPQTKENYPYDFELFFSYRVEGDTLFVTHETYNPSNEPIYCAFGSHESFALKSDVGDYEVEFENEEVFDSLIHTDDTGKLTGEIKSFGKGAVLPLPADFLQDGRTLIFADLRSQKCVLRKKTGEGVAEISFDGFPNLLFWRPHGAKMICVEPWQNLPDYEGKELVEFKEKLGIDKINPKERKISTRSIKYL